MYSDDKPPPYSPSAPATTIKQPTAYGNVPAPAVTSDNPYGPIPQGTTGPYGPVPPGFTAVPHSAMPGYGSTTYLQPVTTVNPQVVIIGGCPACRVGILEDDYPCLGICLAVFCFPIGMLCCLAMKQHRCSSCGAIFG